MALYLSGQYGKLRDTMEHYGKLCTGTLDAFLFDIPGEELEGVSYSIFGLIGAVFFFFSGDFEAFGDLIP